MTDTSSLLLRLGMRHRNHALIGYVLMGIINIDSNTSTCLTVLYWWIEGINFLGNMTFGYQSVQERFYSIETNFNV